MWLLLDPSAFEVWGGSCRPVTGTWAAGSAAMLAAGHSSDARCDRQDVDAVFRWAGGIRAYTAAGDGWELLSASGEVVARLSAPGESEPPADLTGRIAAADGLPSVGRAGQGASPPAPLPTDLTSIAPWELVGRWVPATGTAPGDPHVTFGEDGRWSADDGCHDSTGGWALDRTGRLLTMPPAGVTDDKACVAQDGQPYAPMLSWLGQATHVGLDGDVLVLVDPDGAPLARLVAAHDLSGREPVAVVDVLPTEDGGVGVNVAACNAHAELTALEEDVDEVRVQVTANRQGRAGDGCADLVEVPLQEPLGDRLVVDITTGRELVLFGTPLPVVAASATDGGPLELTVKSCFALPHAVVVAAAPDEVRVRATAVSQRQARTDQSCEQRTEVTLPTPLGDRRLVDDTTGEIVPVT